MANPLKKIQHNLNYLSLFSGAGIGCYGFQLENFECIATVEILEKRLKIQQFNRKCKNPEGYIGEDITSQETKNNLERVVKKYLKESKAKEIDVIIATPPCQGMSVANHKKKHEIKRNSLVVESIVLTKKYLPRYFVFENVKSFLNTLCTDIDGVDKKITDAIDTNLGGNYNILKQVINFKSYGSNSSRTRTLVIGIRKDIKDLTPYDIFPNLSKEKTLHEVIGHLTPLKKMGEISPDDIYHQFKPYADYMRDWIHTLKQGESAFDHPETYPYKIVNGVKIKNQNKNGDKYRRQIYKNIAPCIHTRNDILASQNTVHPKDDRVFSIRELMLMMTIPNSFKWSPVPFEELNKLNLLEKRAFLKKEEMNIRSCIGEAVPTEIFRKIAKKIKDAEQIKKYKKKELQDIILKNDLSDPEKLARFIKTNKKLDTTSLMNIAELANAKRTENAAYYTHPDICFTVVNSLPDFNDRKEIKILEPSVGAGSFVPLLLEKYKNIPKVYIDLVDIDNHSIKNVQLILNKIPLPGNIKIRFICGDFLTQEFDTEYDLIIGNPPFGKIKNKPVLAKYKFTMVEPEIENIYIFFLERALLLGKYIAFILPKSFLSSPIYKNTREKLKELTIEQIVDYGEKGFNGVKIETISIILKNRKNEIDNIIRIESYINNSVTYKRKDYISESQLPYWLIYRNDFFDKILKKNHLSIFKVFRDRQITKKHTMPSGKYRVLKSRNIGSNKTIDIPGYDCYINDLSNFAVKKFLNQEKLILVPNLTYKPRATFLPPETLVDGSVAILIPQNKNIKITKDDLEYYSSEEFRRFYMIGRNLGSRSLNIDSNSVFYFGKRKSNGKD